MAKRRNPNSYVSLDRVMNRVKQRAAGIPIANLPFLAVTWNAFLAQEILWKKEYSEMKKAGSDQVAATALSKPATDELYMFTSHFYQVLNFAIDRGEIPASVRILYGLPGDSSRLPAMSTEAEKLTAAQNIIDGEAARITAGGVALAYPSAAQVAQKLTAFNNMQQSQSQQKQNLSKEEKDVAGIYSAVRLAVLDLFDELEFNNRRQTSGFIRNLLQEWGMEYSNETGEVFEQTILIAAGTTLVLTEIALNPDSKITATLLTALANGSVALCRNAAGCGPETNKTLVFNAALTVTAAELPGTEDSLVLTNTSGQQIEVKVRIEG